MGALFWFQPYTHNLSDQAPQVRRSPQQLPLDQSRNRYASTLIHLRIEGLPPTDYARCPNRNSQRLRALKLVLPPHELGNLNAIAPLENRLELYALC